MDPKANLLEQISIAQAIQARIDADVNDQMCVDASKCFDMIEDAGRLAELVLALDEWIRKGGFSPYYVGKGPNG